MENDIFISYCRRDQEFVARLASDLNKQVAGVWFLTGMFAGWQVVRHIRMLEPGITRREGWGVSLGWGCGAIVATIVALIVIGMLSSILRL